MRALGRVLKIKFTPEEDERLLEIVRENGTKDWILISYLLGTRNPRQCRERYKNYLDPSLRHCEWTPEEDALLMQKYLEFGAKWNKIGRFFTNRSDNALRNRWQLMNRRQQRGTAQPDVFWPETVPTFQGGGTKMTAERPSSIDLPDVVPIEKKPEVSFGSLFALCENMQLGSSLFADDPFDSWTGLD
jgi:hypothetical protein